jgi:uncharacterized heparinase superfamily protein
MTMAVPNDKPPIDLAFQIKIDRTVAKTTATDVANPLRMVSPYFITSATTSPVMALAQSHPLCRILKESILPDGVKVMEKDRYQTPAGILHMASCMLRSTRRLLSGLDIFQSTRQNPEVKQEANTARRPILTVCVFHILHQRPNFFNGDS